VGYFSEFSLPFGDEDLHPDLGVFSFRPLSFAPASGRFFFLVCCFFIVSPPLPFCFSPRLFAIFFPFCFNDRFSSTFWSLPQSEHVVPRFLPFRETLSLPLHASQKKFRAFVKGFPTLDFSLVKDSYRFPPLSCCPALPFVLPRVSFLRV